jgi:hypothetical protein
MKRWGDAKEALKRAGKKEQARGRRRGAAIASDAMRGEANLASLLILSTFGNILNIMKG